MKDILISLIDKTLKDKSDKAVQVIEEENEKLKNVVWGLEQFKARADKMVEAFEKVNLKIDFSYPNPFHFEKDFVHYSVRAKPIGKFKLIKFRGYTSQGAGKNQKALYEKANKISEIIKEIGQFDSVEVNPFVKRKEVNKNNMEPPKERKPCPCCGR